MLIGTKARSPRIALTGGIACGKSLVARFLNELGVETVDADDIVHELVPADERRRLAKVVFADPAARKALETKLHPLVRDRINQTLDESANRTIAVVPLLFETRWDADYDIICCVTSSRDVQISRMMTTRGYSREEAEARLEAQLPVEAKAAKSHYVIDNSGSTEELKAKVAAFWNWLKGQIHG